MRSLIVQQFKHPSGVLGRMAGWMMTDLSQPCEGRALIVDFCRWA